MVRISTTNDASLIIKVICFKFAFPLDMVNHWLSIFVVTQNMLYIRIPIIILGIGKDTFPNEGLVLAFVLRRFSLVRTSLLRRTSLLNSV